MAINKVREEKFQEPEMIDSCKEIVLQAHQETYIYELIPVVKECTKLPKLKLDKILLWTEEEDTMSYSLLRSYWQLIAARKWKPRFM